MVLLRQLINTLFKDTINITAIMTTVSLTCQKCLTRTVAQASCAFCEVCAECEDDDASILIIYESTKSTVVIENSTTTTSSTTTTTTAAS